MMRDPIVDEIHQTRQKILADCNGDLDKLMDRYKSSEDRDRSRLVTLETVRKRRHCE